MPLGAEDYAGASSLLQLLGQAAQAQAFSSTGQPQTRFDIDRLAWDSRQQALVLQARVAHLPRHAWAHLLAMLQKNDDALEELAQVHIVAAHAGPQDVVTVEALFAAVPQDWHTAEPGFPWEAPGVDKSRNLRLEMSFAGAPTAEQVQAVDDALGLWQQMNILGAFDMDLGPADDLDPLGGVRQISPHTLVCSIPYFRGHISGLVALLGIVQHIHRNLAIEEAVLD
ncbi:MAG: hypothetical protein EOP39_08445 [Rubrivivax sp.]|nr:MAG: hypothetical protein EOP39_08445 [Rubrivivax sp.]